MKHFDYSERQCALDQRPAAGHYADKTGRHYLCEPHMNAVIAKYFSPKDNLRRIAAAVYER